MRALAILLLFALSACTTPPQVTSLPPATDDLSVWNAHKLYLLAHEQWTAHFSLIGVNSGEKFKTRVVWEQKNDQYEIKLKDFIGRTVAVVNGDSQSVTVKTSKGQRFEGTDANSLVQELFGLEIPVQGMRYWLRAVPRPQQEYELMALNDDGLAQNMMQAGWQLHYEQYDQYEDASLPTRTVLQFSDLTLTVKVSRWELPPAI